MKKHYNLKTLVQGAKSLVAILMVTLMAAGNVFAQAQQYQLVNESQADWSGTYLLVSAPSDGAQAGNVVALNGLSTTSTTYGLFENVTAHVSGDVIASNATTDAAVVTIAAGSEGYTIYQDGVGYFGWSSGNSLKAAATAADNHYEWTFSIVDGNLTIANVNTPARHLQFNANSPRFACYTSVQAGCKLYKLGAAQVVAVAAPTFTVASGTYFATQTVTIEGPAGATIYYTTDATAPTTASTEYTAPITVSSTTTLSAIAVIGDETSHVATATYTIRIPVEVANIAAFKAAAGSDIYKITGPVTVLGQYSNKYYTFVQDGTGALYIYGTMANAYNPGDVINDGVYGTYDLYNGLTEMKPVSGLPTGQGLAGTPIQPVVVSLATIVDNYADYEAKLVTIENVTIAADRTFGTSSSTRGVNISQNGATAQIYNTLGTITGKQVHANDVVNVTGYVIRYNNTIEIVPRSTSDIVEVVANLPYTINFDNVTDDGFMLNNGTATNKWFIGQASGFDNNKLFITSNNGSTNKYENVTSTVKATRRMLIPTAGATLTFDYRVMGNASDNLKVSVVKNNEETVLATLYGSNDWMAADLNIAPALAGEVDLVFTWTNNASVDNQFPAAIDNISVVETSCMQPTALTTTVNGTTAVVTWTAPADQTAWTVEYKYADHNEWHSVNATSTTVTLAGLDGNTTYDVRVKANCGSASSAWTAGQFTIDCQNGVMANIDVTVGTGSTTNSSLPFYGYYNYTYSQQIYDASELNIPAGPITSISFDCTTVPSNNDRTGDIRIWLANTTKSTFANNTDYIDPATLTQVVLVSGVHPFVSGWNTFTFDQPFMYDGTSNLVVAYYEGYSGYASMSFHAQSTTDNKSIAHYSDTYASVSYTTPATAAGSKYFSKYRSDIKLSGSGIVCQDQPACAEPENLTVSDVTNATANVAWTADADQTAWIVEYKANNASTWSTMNVTATTATITGLNPATDYTVRVAANCGNGSYSEYIATSFRTLSACMEPANLTIAAVNGTTVDVTWTPRGIENTWMVQYKKVNETTWMSVPVSNTAWITLSGLSELTDYNVRVKAVCGVDSQSEWITGNFTTGCETKQMPYEEGFEDYATQTSDIDCWAFINNRGYSGDYPKAYVNNSSSYVHTGNRSLYFQSALNASIYAILPAISGDDATLSFWYRNEGVSAYNGVLSVGYMTNVNDQNSFVALQTLPQTTTFTHIEVEVGSLAGKRLAFQYTGGTANNYYLGIDDISVAQTVHCLNPDMITVSNIQNSTADVAWTPRGDGLEWEVEYGVAGFAHGSGTTVTSTLPSVTLSGLTPGETYDVYVRSLCGQAQSNWSDAVNFTTYVGCAPVTVTAANPFVENFNTLTSGIPACWDNTDGTVNPSVDNPWSYNAAGKTGACVMFDSYYNDDELTNFLKTPVLNLSAINNPQLKIAYKNPTGGDFSIYLSLDGGHSYNTLVASGLTGASNWTDATFALPLAANQNNVVVVFKGTSNYGNGDANIYLDNVEVGETPSCQNPTAFTASNITGTTVDLSWTAGGNENAWIIEYGPTGFAHGTGTTVNVNATQYTLTGLSGATAYDVYVRANCGHGDLSAWSDAVHFSTPFDCANTVEHEIGTGTSAANTIPFNTYYKNSWNETIYPASEFGGNPCYITGIRYYSNATATLATTNVKIYLSTTDKNTFSTTTDWTPQGDLTLVYDANGVNLGGEAGWQTFNFDVPYFYSGNGNVVVSVTKTASSYNSSVQYRYTTASNTCMYRQSDSSPYNEYSSTISGTRSGNRANAQFITCPIQVTCPSPVVSPNVTVTTHTATVQWTPGGSETQWEVSYTLNGTTTTQTVTSTSFTINNLNSATQYSIPFSVTAICSADDQSFPINKTLVFTTDCELFTLPYTENFDSYTTTSTSMSTSVIPTCWDRSFSGTSTSYGGGIYYGSTYANSDVRCLRLYNYLTTSTSASYGDIYVVLPELDADLDVAAITFQARRSTTTNYSSMFQVGIVTDMNNLAGSFTPIQTITPSGATYEPFTVSLEGHHTGRIAFFMNRDKETSRTGVYNYAYIDDIEVYQAVFTRDLNLISVEGIDDNCDLSNVPVTFTVQNDNATADVASFTASYSINGGAPVTETFTPTALASGQQATFTFTQLANFTDPVNALTVTLTYSGDGNSSNDVYTINNINLITPFSLPYFEDFTNVTMGQGGWIADARNANPVMWTVVNGTPTYTFSDEFNASSYMVSPCISIPAGQYVISYDYNALGLLPENMTVYVASSPAPADWTVINQHQNFTHTAYGNHVDYVFNNAVSGVYYIVVKAASVRGSNGMTFDNLSIAPAVNVTVNTGANGTSTPNGNVTVASGSDLIIHIMPNAGYQVASISVNGTQVMGADITNANVFDYTLTNITEATTVDVTFAPAIMTVNKYVYAATPFGHFVPAGPQTVAYGGDATINVVADPHYHLSGLYVSNFDYYGGELAGAVDVLANTTQMGNTYTYQMNNIYHNKSVLACFKVDTVGIFYTVYGQGVVENQYVVDANTPTPAYFSRYIDYGTGFFATFAPAVGYHVESITINGVNYGGIEAFDFYNVTEPQHVVVTFAPNVYTVTTYGYGQGVVTPGATFVYNPDNMYAFAATPITGYRIASVLRNNIPMVVADPEGTFTDTLVNILDNYVYEVAFAPMTYIVNASCGSNGLVTPIGATSYFYNENGVYTVTANEGYYISSVTIDGNTTNYTQADGMNSYTYTFAFNGLNAVDHSISATFAPYQYTITVTDPTHGTITPGTSTYNYNQSPVFTITPAAGYGIVDVTVDGNSVGAVSTYTFPALRANHTLAATFAQYQYTISASAGNGGTISPVGTSNLVSGGNQTYTIAPATGYHVSDVFVDGASVGAVTSYTFSNVTANHTIFAAFEANEYTVTVNQPANGVITPGTTTVVYQATPTFVITPNTGYSVTAITLNGNNVMSQATNNNGVYTYTLPAVTANATLSATMTIKSFTITATAGSNGSINGPSTVNYGANATYTITPAAGYVVDNVTVDGFNMGAIATYTFNNVTANHTIHATFRLQDCVIPTNMHTNNITTTTATFSWYHPIATSFEVQYKPISATTFTSATVNATTYNVANLLPGTAYVWMVRANCGNNNYSEWSNANVFTTEEEIIIGIDDYTAQDLVKVYASHNNIYIVNENGVRIDNAQVYDIYGKLLYSGSVNNSPEVISMNVATGTYMVKLSTDRGTANYKLYLTR